MSELNELAAALAKAQGEIEPAPKDADNPYFKSKYSTLSAVRNAVQSAFAKHGLSVVQMPIVEDGQVGLRTLLLHSSGQTLDCGTLLASVDLTNCQKAGSAISYFRRYALSAVGQTVSEDDDDGNEASKEIKYTISEKKEIEEATSEILKQTNLEDLDMLGLVFKEKKSPKIRNAIRKAFSDHRLILKGKTDANSRSN